jgi:ABC-type dipeptide/oligopeptide/nickel transport system permease subunit
VVDRGISGFGIFTTVLGLNLLGDCPRDLLDRKGELNLG